MKEGYKQSECAYTCFPHVKSLSYKIKLTMSRAVIIPNIESSTRKKSGSKYCKDTIQEPMTVLLDFNQPMTVFNEPFAVYDITAAVSRLRTHFFCFLYSLLTFS